MNAAARISVCSLLLAAGSAESQYIWNTMVSGTWNNGANWAGPASPSFPSTQGATAEISAGGTYTVTVENNNWAVNTITKTNPNATLLIDSRALQIYGSIVNQGDTVIAADPGRSSFLRFRGTGARSITGTGTIQLLSNGTNNQSAAIDRGTFDEAVVTFGSGQTITGQGRLTVPFVNQGLISATSGSTNTINTSDDTAVNQAVISATSGGIIQLTDVALDGQNTGVINIDDASLEFNGSVFAQRLANATVNITNGGVARSVNGNADLENVVFNGDSEGDTRRGFRFFGSFFKNNGTMTLGGDGVNSFDALRIGATPYAFSGTGQMILNHPAMTNPGAAPTISPTLAGVVLTNGANHTIRGKYRVATEMINLGTMTADNPGETVQFVGAPLENRGTLRATNSGILELRNDTIQSGGGGIDLDGGFLDFGGVGGGIASLTGGSIAASNGGKLLI